MPEKNSSRFDEDTSGGTARPDGEDRRSEGRWSDDHGPDDHGPDDHGPDGHGRDGHGPDVRAPEALAANGRRYPERPADQPRKPVQRTAEQRTAEQRTAERRAVEPGTVDARRAETRTAEDRAAGARIDGTPADERQVADRTGAGPAPALRKPAAERVIPRQPTGSDALDSRSGTAGPVTPGAGPGEAGRDGLRAPGPWLETAQVQRLSAQWRAVQTGFVDDPRAAVEQADALVGKAADLLAESVGENRRRLRGAGEQTEDSGIPTEELRLAMREYHTLLDRLLAS
ncbi:hypothetical protein OG689_01275 [Kitasatospora sp. NBC_00240]|uniref:hypothetical protein n=1 Tax=Kitasatospora sp. NBC_00240 TaxID=2903567 RepID=UPI00224EF42D|nr:hypothetical protein [Kitasatospora sp. NBC_00240]MCX5207962.1 hypothetical protein [Kitasatospora sp. NBC_00240]